MSWTRSVAISSAAILALGLAARDILAQSITVPLISPNPNAYGSFGRAVSGAGDVNGDGIPEVIVAAVNEDVGENPQVGRAYVFAGPDGGLLHTLSSPNPQTLGYFGYAVSGEGDVNGDGRADLVVGAPGEMVGALEEAGRVYVFDGATGTLLYPLESPNAEFSGFFGGAVSMVRDLDGDGRDDVAVGALERVGIATVAGRAYVFSGADGALIHTLTSPNPQTSGHFGDAVSDAGDVDGDGVSDIVVGASWEHDGGFDDSGRAYVFSGTDGELIHTLVSEDPTTGGNFGVSVAGARDVNLDGRADLVVGALDEDGGEDRAGRAYVFSGLDGSVLHTLVSPNPDMFGLFGRSVSGVGDVDGDQHPDVAIGSEEDIQGVINAGRVYIMSGSDGTVLHTLTSPNQDSFGFFGYSVSGVDSFTGSGTRALVVGAFNEEGGSVNAGRAYVFGFDSPVAVEEGLSSGMDVLLLEQNHPNTFSRMTTIGFRLPTAGPVTLAVFSPLGRRIVTLVDGMLPAGDHRIAFDGGGLASGAYFYRLEAPGLAPRTRAMTLLR